MADRLPKKPPEDDVETRWLQLPATYCDSYSVRLWTEPDVVRLVFGEFVGREYLPYYRASIIMPVSDAKALVRTLGKLIDDYEKEKAEDKGGSKAISSQES